MQPSLSSPAAAARLTQVQSYDPEFSGYGLKRDKNPEQNSVTLQYP